MVKMNSDILSEIMQYLSNEHVIAMCQNPRYSPFCNDRTLWNNLLRFKFGILDFRGDPRTEYIRLNDPEIVMERYYTMRDFNMKLLAMGRSRIPDTLLDISRLDDVIRMLPPLPNNEGWNLRYADTKLSHIEKGIRIHRGDPFYAPYYNVPVPLIDRNGNQNGYVVYT